MELTDILKVWDRFDRSDASEMELDYHGVRLSLKRGTGAGTSSALPEPLRGEAGMTMPEQAVNAPVGRAALNGKGSLAGDEISSGKKISSGKERISGKEIKAPLVGTFYAAPAPDAKAFVEVGQQIRKGDVVCIIEAMKLMNEVTAREDGIVEEILVRDGELVAFEQPLMILRQE